MLITLDYLDLTISACLVLLVALISLWQQLDLHRSMLFAAVRSFIQLSLVGLVLAYLFRQQNLVWLAGWAVIMLMVAGREVNVRQKHRMHTRYGFALSIFSMFCSSFLLTVFALVLVVGTDPWWQPQYAIPLLGMLLGNTMNGVSLSLDRLTQSALGQTEVIEQRLMQGQRWFEAIADIKREAVRSGMIPAINGMATAGLVALPGMMTGQILSGTSPSEAVKYQIMILFLITSGTGLGVFCATWFGARRLFDHRERFCPEQLIESDG